ncbi:hypothetical protein Hanom_Chr03g00255961 [Helianthus anomalus]
MRIFDFNVQESTCIKKKSKMPFSPLRFGQFSDFRLKVCFSASASKRFEISSILLR